MNKEDLPSWLSLYISEATDQCISLINNTKLSKEEAATLQVQAVRVFNRERERVIAAIDNLTNY